MRNLNPSMRFQIPIWILLAIEKLKTNEELQDDEILNTMKGMYVEGFCAETEAPKIFSKVNFPERIWKIRNDFFHVLIHDNGNGWSYILSIRTNEGIILWQREELR